MWHHAGVSSVLTFLDGGVPGKKLDSFSVLVSSSSSCDIAAKLCNGHPAGVLWFRQTLPAKWNGMPAMQTLICVGMEVPPLSMHPWHGLANYMA